MAKQIKINLSKIAEISKIHTRLKELGNEIFKFEKMAMVMANNKCTLKLNLAVVDLDDANNTIAYIDADGDLITEEQINKHRQQAANFYGVPIHQIQVMGNSNTKKARLTLKETISDSLGLSVLGVVIQNKQAERRVLLDQLKAMGIEV